MNNFHSAMFQANLLYGVSINPDDFEELGLIAWNFIGNKHTRLYRYRACVKDLKVELPCNADIIEAVTLDFEDWNYSTNTHENGDLNSAYVEHYVENKNLQDNPLYIRGKYVNFVRNGDTLYFDKPYGHVNILYKGVILDENGLPELNDKETIAIATYVAYVEKFKQGIITNNGQIINVSNMLEAKWHRLCDAARVPEHINQNEMNEILDAKHSWDRKIFNKSYKPIS